MRYLLSLALGLMLLASAGAQDVEMAGIGVLSGDCGLTTGTRTVVNLEAGGKYHIVDGKTIKRGETCRIDPNSVICRIGQEEGGGVEVRYVLFRWARSGHCPDFTPFTITSTEWAAAQKASKDSSVSDYVRALFGRDKKN